MLVGGTCVGVEKRMPEEWPHDIQPAATERASVKLLAFELPSSSDTSKNKPDQSQFQNRHCI